MANCYRIRCGCDNVFDADNEGACPSCGKTTYFGSCGFLELYRMGNVLGCGAKIGLYIDDQPYGYIANTQCLRIAVPFGIHRIKCSFPGTRAGKDIEFTVSESENIAYAKMHIKAGFWKNTPVIELASKDSMPEFQ